MTEMRQVYSSHIDSVGYDEATKTLMVTWSSGKTSAYSGVPSELADQVTNSPSVGEALRASIKGVYPHRYV